MKRLGKIVYLAGPYSHPESSIRMDRYNKLTEVSARLMDHGYFNFSPITHSHHQQAYMNNNSTTFAFWKDNDLAFISRLDAVYVLLIPGWRESLGVTAEIAFAEANGIPVKYLEVDFSLKPVEIKFVRRPKE